MVIMRMPVIMIVVGMPIIMVIPPSVRTGRRRHKDDGQYGDGQQALYHGDKSLVEDLEREDAPFIAFASEREMNGTLRFAAERAGSRTTGPHVEGLSFLSRALR
jgi:hypothetical protein